MKNAMQLKAVVKNIAKEKKISAQLVLQNYMLERFLERVSVSEYRNNFIIKGGFLIASMVGLNSRATMDMDATIKRYPVSEEAIQKMVEEIIKINLSEIMNRQWQNYQKDFDYAAGIEFRETCDAVVRIMESLPIL